MLRKKKTLRKKHLFTIINAVFVIAITGYVCITYITHLLFTERVHFKTLALKQKEGQKGLVTYVLFGRTTHMPCGCVCFNMFAVSFCW